MKKKLRNLFYPVGKQKNTLDFYTGFQKSSFNESVFYQTAGRLFNYNRGTPNPGTKELIDALLTHGARAARLNQPHVHIAINAFKPDGYKAVKIKMAR